MLKMIFKQPLGRILLLVFLMVCALYYYYGRKPVQNGGTSFTAKRGTLQISVLEGGSAEALESQEIRSQIKGYQGTKILSIVEEGYLVTEEDIANGKILVELDSSELKQKITTEEIQFQSTLSTMIEAQQAYDITYNQNISDLKAAEQKVRFALMDFQKYVGDSNAVEIITKLNLKEPSYVVDFEQAEKEAEALFAKVGGSDGSSPQVMMNPSITMPPNMQFPGGGNNGFEQRRSFQGDPSAPDSGGGRRMGGGMQGGGRGEGGMQSGMQGGGRGEGMQGVGRGEGGMQGGGRGEGMQGSGRGEGSFGGQRGNFPGGQRPDGAGFDRSRSRTNRPPSGENMPREFSGRGEFGSSNAMMRMPGNMSIPGNMQMPGSTGLTNLTSIPEIRSVKGTNTSQPVVISKLNIDFTQYADTNKLGDGTAQQTLRKLLDDQLSATQTRLLDVTKRDGTQRLFDKQFATKTELDNDNNRVLQDDLRVKTAQTALDLFIKYEFVRSAEDFLSKYDEALRLYERARKEAISKLAQARARLKSAEGRYRIEMDQRAELYDQFTNCVIRAKRPGLVVYGGSGGGDRRGFSSEEPIREGATVRERQSIITIPDMTRMSVKVKIHESHIKKVKKGQKARVQVDAFPDQKLMAEVTKVAVLPDSADRWMNPDLKVYGTSIAIEGSREWLKPGMSAKVEILIDELPNVVYVPIQAVFPINGKQYCFVVNGKNPDQRAVEVGQFNDEFIEIKTGLKEGEKVMLRAPEGIESDLIRSEDENASANTPGNVPSASAGSGKQPRGDISGGGGGGGGGMPGQRSNRSRGQ